MDVNKAEAIGIIVVLLCQPLYSTDAVKALADRLKRIDSDLLTADMAMRAMTG